MIEKKKMMKKNSDSSRFHQRKCNFCRCDSSGHSDDEELKFFHFRLRFDEEHDTTNEQPNRPPIASVDLNVCKDCANKIVKDYEASLWGHEKLLLK
jgi:hypothetical protein